MSNESTREKLIDAAEILFAEKGFDGVSVRDIAGAAGANIAAINYHFQGKEALYRATLERRLISKRDRILSALERDVAAADGHPSPERLIRTFVRVYLEDALETPEAEIAMRLIAREIIEPQYGTETICGELIGPVHRGFAGILARAMPDLPERQVFMILGSLIAQVVHFFLRWRNIRPDREGDRNTEAFRDAFPVMSETLEDYLEMVIDHVTEFTLGGIAALRGETGQ